MADILCFTSFAERREIVRVQKELSRWDRAADALKRRDYDLFDQIMGKRAYAGAGDGL